MDEIKSQKAKKISKLVSYAKDTAGALMITEYLSYGGDMLVKDVLDDLRAQGEAYSDYDIQYAYVISDSGRLIGVLRLRDLLMAPRSKTISEIMIKEPLHFNVNMALRWESYLEARPFSGKGIPGSGWWWGFLWRPTRWWL